MPYKNVLVATAFSENCERTLSQAKSIATTYHAKLHLVHFVEPLPASAFSYAGSPLINEQRLQGAKEKLALVGKKFEISAEDCYLEEALPKAGIVNLAKTLNADLIVLGNHGDNFIASLMGCTANSVLHHALCDILIVK